MLHRAIRFGPTAAAGRGDGGVWARTVGRRLSSVFGGVMLPRIAKYVRKHCDVGGVLAGVDVAVRVRGRELVPRSGSGSRDADDVVGKSRLRAGEAGQHLRVAAWHDRSAGGELACAVECAVHGGHAVHDRAGSIGLEILEEMDGVGRQDHTCGR